MVQLGMIAFPAMVFDDWHPDSFPGKEAVVNYFENFAKKLMLLSIVGKRLQMFLRSRWRLYS